MELLRVLRRRLIKYILVIIALTLVISLAINLLFSINYIVVFILVLLILSSLFSYIAILKRRHLITDLSKQLIYEDDLTLFENENLMKGRGFTDSYFQKISLNICKEGVLLSFNFAKDRRPLKINWELIVNCVEVDDAFISFSVIGCDVILVLPFSGILRQEFIKKVDVHEP